MRLHKEVRPLRSACYLAHLAYVTSFSQNYEEIVIPAPKAVPFRFNEALVPIKDMNPWGKRTFHVSQFPLPFDKATRSS